MEYYDVKSRIGIEREDFMTNGIYEMSHQERWLSQVWLEIPQDILLKILKNWRGKPRVKNILLLKSLIR
jgi:hypothetical protein